MKIFVFSLLIISLLIAPIFVYADCSKTGTTVIFVNGMFTFSQSDAESNVTKLWTEYNRRGKNSDIVFTLGYNPSHIGGIGDMVNAVTQAYGLDTMDYDLTNILLKAHTDVKTQKIMLVGHSQGTFYTNTAYNYLIKYGGVDKNSIAVYNVGTPADNVAGGGKYLTSSTDKVIVGVVKDLTTAGFARKPLPANIDLKLSSAEEANHLGGHSFSDVYLAEAPDRIISDMDAELNNLSASGDKSECFIAPKPGVAYWIAGKGYAFADGVVSNSDAFVTSPTPNQLSSLANSLFNGIYNFGAGVVSGATQILSQNNFFGASLSSPLTQNNNQNSSNNSNPASTSISTLNPAESAQDQLDSTQESLDLSNPQTQAQTASSQQTQNNAKETIATVYPKILINEVQTAGSVNAKNEFVELYNLNTADVALDGWSLKKRGSTGQGYDTYVSKNAMNGTTIPAKGYYLLARKNSDFESLANVVITVGQPLRDDNTLVLENPNGDTSDKVGWGAAQDYETKPTINPPVDRSIIRIWDSINKTSQDTDNNYVDFGMAVSVTPKIQNSAVATPYFNLAVCYLGAAGSQTTQAKYGYLASNLNPGNVTRNTVTNGGIVPQNVPVGSNTVRVWSSNAYQMNANNFVWTVSIDGTTKTSTIDTLNGHAPSFYDTMRCPDICGDGSCGGNETCSTCSADCGSCGGGGGSVTLSITTYTISNPIISPNGDGVKDTTSIDLAFSENVDYSISIVSGATIIKNWSGNATNPDAKIWDGKNASGAVVPDGIYTIKIVITDSAKNSITDTSKTITVDNSGSPPSQTDTTPPVITLIDKSEITINKGDAYADAGATASDDTDGDITLKIAIINPVDKNTIGDYTITYNVSDTAGNHAVQVTRLVHVVAPPPKILITEVQVAGQTANDEFIELYNPNNVDIDLSGFALKKKTSSGTESNLVSSAGFSGTIPANRYFLIVPQSGYMGAATPDLHYSGASYSITPNNTVLLYNNNGILLDKVGFGTASDFETASDSETAPAPEPSANQSIQRIWDLTANQPQDTDDNSADFHVFSATTPKSASPQYCSSLYDNFTFAQNTTLKKSCVYVFKGNVSVSQGITLTLEPGVIIKFYDKNSNLAVNGTLKAGNDTDTEKIIFTSYKDDVYGGDTNGDGSSSPNMGDWQAINFTSTSLNSELHYAVVQYGGYSSTPSSGFAIKADNSPISIKNSIIQNNINRGLYLINSTATIDSDQFLGQNDSSDPSFKDSAIDVFGGSGQITNNYFKDNIYGISLSDWNLFRADFDVQNNNFEITDDPPAYEWPVALNTFYGPSFSGNQILNNNKKPGSFAAILVNADMENGKDAILNPDMPYLFDKTLEIPEGTTLTLNPGVIIDFQSNNAGGMNIDGTLKTIGNGSPIIFRGYYYDQGAKPGNWDGLFFSEKSKDSDLENIDISLGGSQPPFGFGAAIKVDQSSISLNGSKVHDNANYGVWLQNSSSIIDNTQFSGHHYPQLGGPPKAAAVFIEGGSPEVGNSVFSDNDNNILQSDTIPSTPNLHDNTFQ